MKITLCGSARFEDLFHAWDKKLTLLGHVVYGLAVYPSFMGNQKEWYTAEEKTKLDLAHLAKIENSDCILVLNPEGYIGESTAREILWAQLQGKMVYYLEVTKAGQEDSSELTDWGGWSAEAEPGSDGDSTDGPL